MSQMFQLNLKPKYEIQYWSSVTNSWERWMEGDDIASTLINFEKLEDSFINVTWRVFDINQNQIIIHTNPCRGCGMCGV